MEIKENSLDALCLFALYICAQDNNLSKDETTRIFSNIPSLAQYYFELFGEFSSLHLHQVSIALNEFLLSEDRIAIKEAAKSTVTYFDNLISDQNLRLKAIEIAKDAAEVDGIHNLEQKQINFWRQRWS